MVNRVVNWNRIVGVSKDHGRARCILSLRPMACPQDAATQSRVKPKADNLIDCQLFGSLANGRSSVRVRKRRDRPAPDPIPLHKPIARKLMEVRLSSTLSFGKLVQKDGNHPSHLNTRPFQSHSFPYPQLSRSRFNSGSFDVQKTTKEGNSVSLCSTRKPTENSPLCLPRRSMDSFGNAHDLPKADNLMAESLMLSLANGHDIFRLNRPFPNRSPPV